MLYSTDFRIRFHLLGWTALPSACVSTASFLLRKNACRQTRYCSHAAVRAACRRLTAAFASCQLARFTWGSGRLVTWCRAAMHRKSRSMWCWRRSGSCWCEAGLLSLRGYAETALCRGRAGQGCRRTGSSRRRGARSRRREFCHFADALFLHHY